MSERIELTKQDLVKQEKCMEEVRAILLARYPDGFDSEKSIHRKEYENA